MRAKEKRRNAGNATWYGHGAWTGFLAGASIASNSIALHCTKLGIAGHWHLGSCGWVPLGTPLWGPRERADTELTVGSSLGLRHNLEVCRAQRGAGWAHLRLHFSWHCCSWLSVTVNSRTRASRLAPRRFCCESYRNSWLLSSSWRLRSCRQDAYSSSSLSCGGAVRGAGMVRAAGGGGDQGCRMAGQRGTGPSSAR